MDIFLEPLDLAALLCSRVCHDVISPVGAIINGLEILEDEKDPETRVIAIELIKKSATTASAKLQFCRLAFGAAGSAGASIDTGDAENVTRGLLPEGKMTLRWEAPRVLMPKNQVKLILNMCLIAIASIPRGGVLTVQTGREGDPVLVHIEATGTHIRVAHGVANLLSGQAEGGAPDAHAIQPYFTYLVAEAAALDLSLRQDSDKVVIEARHKAAAIEPESLSHEAEEPDHAGLDAEAGGVAAEPVEEPAASTQGLRRRFAPGEF
ncbi:histidine phosphotransferase family protein [Lichenihabitans sp. Uapishka_5]|uniref:histidine phosphotransferase ChpT n=1 Tax=Lichenihabitans sp. Uapishka_5 TaxID=3037302 RepID=UPI0029E7FB80|nr:histidine phosphotransferase family protein [Lichenihabitans sp. Uapishka_5]MDX7950635.1 histidine phosphotransferase family protein [Lichenihabitans sp. Uapishka_5]